MTDSCLRQSTPAVRHKLSFKSGSVSYSLFMALLFHVSCQIVQMYISTLGFRSDQNRCERAAKFDVKAAFASPSALSFPEMPTCGGMLRPPGLAVAVF